MITTIIAAALLNVAAVAPPAYFEPIPCPESIAVPTARCGIVRVPESRGSRRSRVISLNIVVLPAVPSPANLPPLFDLEGGPGLPSTRNASFYAGNGISRNRDVVMIDQRGTGRSNPLLCPKIAALLPTQPMLPLGLVRECRNSLQTKADLRSYGTVEAVEDLDAVRRALGYAKIDMFGMSYGTTVALGYMQRHPSAVRAVVLMGTAPPSLLPPQHHATAGARALDLLFDDCARKPACNSAYPSLRADLTKAMSRLAKQNASISGELFVERLRAMLYSPVGRSTVPQIITRAARGDVSPLFKRSPDNGGAVADGMFLAITCGESFPLMNYERAAAAARKTVFGDYRLRRQRAACRDWPPVRLDPQHLRLPDADIPVLLLSGNMDPVTPPGLAEAVARQLPRARHLILAEGGHVPDGLTGLEECLDPLMIAFLERADPAKLDASCVAGMKAPPYAVLEMETNHE